MRTSVLTKEAVLPLAAVTSVTGAGRLVLQVKPEGAAGMVGASLTVQLAP